MVTQVEQYEAENRNELERLVSQGREVQCAIKKREFSVQCAEIYSDLMGAEEVLRWKQLQKQQQQQQQSKDKKNDDTNKPGGGYYEHTIDDDDDDDWSQDEKEEGTFTIP